MQNAANRIASRENENNTKKKIIQIIIQYAKSNGKLFRMNNLMGNSNHTFIIITTKTDTKNLTLIKLEKKWKTDPDW